MNEAQKHDQDKLPMHLIDPLFLESTAAVLAFGAKKYAAWNWAKGTFTWSRLFSAMMRHMWAWWRGEENDPESGLPHLAHAACMLMFLMRYSHSSWGTDDRPSMLDATFVSRELSEPKPALLPHHERALQEFRASTNTKGVVPSEV